MFNVFTSLFLTIATLFMTILAPINSFKAPEDKSDFVPVLRFVVMSDTHVETVDDARSQRIQKAISMAYDDAENDENYKKLDAVLVVGDLTDNGTDYQFRSFKAVFDSVLKEGTQFLAMPAKGHDYKEYKEEVRPYFEKLTGGKCDNHVVINGYHFITVSSTDANLYTEDQIKWMREQLEIAVKDDPNKPVFVTHHEHILDTVYGSAEGEWGIDTFKDIFADYPQIVHFSGHSHYPLNDPRSIWQSKYTAIGTGAITYMEFTVDGESRIHPDNYKKTGQFWLVEVDKDSNVRLRGFDTHGECLLCEYTLRNPADILNREYNEKKQIATSSAPVFTENEVKVTSSFGEYKVTVPKAESTDGKIVFLYRAVVCDKDGNEISSSYAINNYWTYPQYDSVKISVEAEKGNTINVYAENAYGMRSEPIVYEVK